MGLKIVLLKILLHLLGAKEFKNNYFTWAHLVKLYPSIIHKYYFYVVGKVYLINLNIILKQQE